LLDLKNVAISATGIAISNNAIVVVL